MRLVAPVLDREGLLVAGAGTRLEAAVVRALRRLGVQSVLVESDERMPTWEQVSPLADELAALDARLPPADRRGALAELHAAVVRHLAARATRVAEGER
jgi:biotin carboxylase